MKTEGQASAQNAYHVPVLLCESVDGLNIRPGGTYVDVTFGGGGHSREILRRLSGGGRLFAFDRDEDAQKEAAALVSSRGIRRSGQGVSDDGTLAETAGDSSFTFIRGNFGYLSNWMRYYGVDKIDGLLADLGVSSHHLDDGSRGFSFRFDAPLDMRMNTRAATTAADIVNGDGERQLADIFYLYGELRNARRIASAIVSARDEEPITTTGRLARVVEPLMQRGREKKDLARVFQALRIEVNHETDALRDMLTAAARLLAPGGRLVVITYHSLEDRIVKNVMRAGNVDGRIESDFYGRTVTPFTLVNNRVIVPDEEEQTVNPRSRSAKLRIAEKK